MRVWYFPKGRINENRGSLFRENANTWNSKIEPRETCKWNLLFATYIWEYCSSRYTTIYHVKMNFCLEIVANKKIMIHYYDITIRIHIRIDGSSIAMIRFNENVFHITFNPFLFFLFLFLFYPFALSTSSILSYI